MQSIDVHRIKVKLAMNAPRWTRLMNLMKVKKQHKPQKKPEVQRKRQNQKKKPSLKIRSTYLLDLFFEMQIETNKAEQHSGSADESKVKSLLYCLLTGLVSFVIVVVILYFLRCRVVTCRRDQL